MQNNIKNIIKANYKTPKQELPLNHRNRFEEKLKSRLHAKSKKRIYYKIAAVLLVLFSLSIVLNNRFNTKNQNEEVISLSSLSPEFKLIENYYSSAIAYELSQLDINDKNKLIIDKYLVKINALTSQYKKSSAQLNIDNINEESINALIDNLQLQLQLLLQLKEQLKIIKTTKNVQDKI